MTILGWTELLQTKIAKDSEFVEPLTMIHFAGDRLLRLVNDILDSSKLENGVIQLEEVSLLPEP